MGSTPDSCRARLEHKASVQPRHRYVQLVLRASTGCVLCAGPIACPLDTSFSKQTHRIISCLKRCVLRCGRLRVTFLHLLPAHGNVAVPLPRTAWAPINKTCPAPATSAQGKQFTLAPLGSGAA